MVALASPRLQNVPGRAVLYMLAAIAAFAVTDASVKWLTDRYDVWQIVFLSRIVTLLFVLWLARRAGGLGTLRTARPWQHLLRALLGLGMLVTFFYALSAMPLPDAIAVAFAAPLFMTMLSPWLLGERVGPRRWAAVLVGFVGVLIIVRPTGGALDWPASLALTSALLYAVMLIMGRRMSATESSPALVFYFAILSFVASALPMPWVWVTPDLLDAGIFLLMSVGGTAGAYLITQAFRFGEVSLIAPLEYTALLWAMLLGFLLWHDIPSWSMLGGAVLIIGSGIYIARREARLARR